jgi:hypothetical protein
MDVFELCPNEEEMNEFREEETGEEWPEGGMECPVTGCPSGEHWFSRLGSFWSHYHRFHHRFISVFRCPKCGLKDIKKSGIRRHLRRAHNVTEDEGVGRVTEVNTKYVDPKDFRRPRPRIHTEETGQGKSDLAPLFDLPAEYIPRDDKCPIGGFLK